MKTTRFVLHVIGTNVLGLETDGTSEGRHKADFALALHHVEIQSLADRLKAHEKALSPAELEQMGELLFATLFNGTILDTFKKLALEVAQTPGAFLRLELCFSDDLAQVAGLPWEFLRVPTAQRNTNLEPFLAISGKVALVRSVYDTHGKLERVRPGEKLRIGLAISKPKFFKDPLPKYGAIDDGPVQEILDRLSASSISPFKLDDDPELRFVATRNALRTFLRASGKKPHILHYIGHGDLLPDGPALILNGNIKITDADAVSAMEICSLFEEYKPALVFLQSCNTASAGPQALTSLAARLAGASIPVVVAMQYEIQNGNACKFALAFYEALMSGLTLEEAVVHARQSLFDKVDGVNRNFGTPVIYVTTQESQLFQRSAVQGSRDALVEDLLNLPGLKSLEATRICPVYELCFSPAITLLPALRDPNADLEKWVRHLVDTTPIQDILPLPLAFFVATLADRILITHPDLSAALSDWLKKHAHALNFDPANASALILADPLQLDPPCLQLIIEPVKRQQPTVSQDKKLYTVQAWDGRLARDITQEILDSQNNAITEFTEEQLEKAARAYVNFYKENKIKDSEVSQFENLLWIEVCLRDEDLLALTVDSWIADKDTKITLGESYKVVMRSLSRWDEQYRPPLSKNWPAKWETCKNVLDNKAASLHSTLLTTAELELKELEETLKNNQVLGLTFEPSSKKHLPGLLDSGVPIVLWVRSGTDSAIAEQCFKTHFALKDNPDLRHLGDLVRDERNATDSPLNKSIVLLWDNFNHKLYPVHTSMKLD